MQGNNIQKKKNKSNRFSTIQFQVKDRYKTTYIIPLP